jgi:hypothetical protein
MDSEKGRKQKENGLKWGGTMKTKKRKKVWKSRCYGLNGVPSKFIN